MNRGASIFVIIFFKVSPFQPWSYDVVYMYVACVCVLCVLIIMSCHGVLKSYFSL